nr:probable serine/threonine-protein kinase roco9 [Vanessa tameamea]
MAWKIVSFFGIALLALSEAHPPVSEQRVKIENVGKKSEHHEGYAWTYPSYEFSYEVVDSHTHDLKGHHETRNGDEVKGYYWLIQPDGYKRTVKYHADKNSGIKAHVDYTKPHNSNENNNEENNDADENEGNQEENANQENGSENGENGETNQESNGENESNNNNENSNNEAEAENAENENNTQKNSENEEGNQEQEEGINMAELEEISQNITDIIMKVNKIIMRVVQILKVIKLNKETEAIKNTTVEITYTEEMKTIAMNKIMAEENKVWVMGKDEMTVMEKKPNVKNNKERGGELLLIYGVKDIAMKTQTEGVGVKIRTMAKMNKKIKKKVKVVITKKIMEKMQTKKVSK